MAVKTTSFSGERCSILAKTPNVSILNTNKY
jgi:hypothetical protein